MTDTTTARRYLGDTLVLGVGRTGRDVALYLQGLSKNRVSSVTVYGGAASCGGQVTRELKAAGIRVILGTDEIKDEKRYDLAVASPGIPEDSPFFQSARAHATETVSEPELAWRESPERWVAITGTNGKTTTTTLACQLLKRGCGAAVAAGNIGTPTIRAVSERTDGDWMVAELSSFQLETTQRLHPRVACLLNIAPDHLEWHKTMGAYAAAKEKVFQNLGVGDLAIVSDRDSWCTPIRERLLARGLRTLTLDVVADPGGACAAFLRGGRLVVRLDGIEHILLAAGEMGVRGAHNIEDALAGASIALELGVGESVVNDTLRDLRPLEHRIEPCGEVAGVSFVNDSKATNPDSVSKALSSFPKGHVIVLLGGYDKGLDLAPLARDVAARCKVAVCFGDVGKRMAQEVEDAATAERSARVVRREHLRDAFAAAIELAAPKDTVLLSPACSSFDEFKDMEERGRLFKSLVARLSPTDVGGKR